MKNSQVSLFYGSNSFSKRPSTRWILGALCLTIAQATLAQEQTTVRRPQKVQVEVVRHATVHTKNADLLVTETVLPPGSIVEVNEQSFRSPQNMRYWAGAEAKSYDFVSNIKIISAPGFSDQDIKELNEWVKTEGLYMPLSTLANAKVVQSEQPKAAVVQGAPSVPSPKNKSLQLAKESGLWRNEGYDRGPGEPNENDGADATTAAKSALERIQSSNEVVKSAGSQGDNCAACKSDRTRQLYLKFRAQGVPEKPLRKALAKLEQLPSSTVPNRDFMAIVDFTQQSNERRMYILNLATGQVEKYYTSHGRGSGGTDVAQRFGSKNSSHQTPPGFLVTGWGDASGVHHTSPRVHNSPKFHDSLLLKGLEGRNANAAQRKILIHAAPYASEAFVKKNHYVGRSWGCLAVDKAKLPQILNELKGGALVYNYTAQDAGT